MHANPSSVARMAGHPLHPMFVPFPIAFFVGALVTDLVYWRTASMMWETFSVWLITAGLIMGGCAAIAGAIDFLGNRRNSRACRRAGLMRWVTRSRSFWR